MKPIRLLSVVLSILVAAPIAAQTPAQLKQELKTRETAAKKDPEAIYEVGKWAADKALAADAKRLYQAVLKIKPDHAGANEGLGNELYEGKWIPVKDADAMRKKALAAAFAAKGMVEVDGVWVEKDKVADAKKGIFHFEGSVVSKQDLLALQAGRVRHPETGELIDAKHLEKAKNKYFPLGGKWGDEKEADTFHSDPGRPWILRTNHLTVLSTLPLEKVRDLGAQADLAFEKVASVLGSEPPLPANRPIVVIAGTRSEYNDTWGRQLGDGSDASGTFLANQKLEIATIGLVRPAICMNEGELVRYYTRHVAAMAYANSLAEPNGVTLPAWLLHGIGSLSSRFQNDEDASHFSKNLVAKGGAKNLKGFLAGFSINGDVDPVDISCNLFEAGLLVDFAMRGGDAKVTEAMQAVTACITGKAKGGEKAIAKLEAALIEAEPKVATYLQKFVK